MGNVLTVMAKLWEEMAEAVWRGQMGGVFSVLAAVPIVYFGTQSLRKYLKHCDQINAIDSLISQCESIDKKNHN